MIANRRHFGLMAAAILTLGIAAGCSSDDDGPNGGPRPEGSVIAGPSAGPRSPAPTPDETAIAAETPPAAVETTVSIDANATTPAVDATGSFASGAEFTIAFVIQEAGGPYQGYQFDMEWDAAVVGYVRVDHVKPAGLETCSPNATFGSGETGAPQGAGDGDTSRVSAFCLNTQLAPVTFAGAVSNVVLRCAAPGTTTIHLRTSADGAIGTKVQEQSENSSTEHTLTLNDATITCT